MATTTMECLNRELMQCDGETIKKVKKQVYDLEATYKAWLVTERKDDETCFYACSSSPCKNYGICVVDDTYTDGFYCECIEGFEGDYCEIRKCLYVCVILCLRHFTIHCTLQRCVSLMLLLSVPLNNSMQLCLEF